MRRLNYRAARGPGAGGESAYNEGDRLLDCHAELRIFNDWPNASDLLGFMMVDTYDSRDLPRAIFVPPYMNELRFTDSAMVLFPGVKESMNSNLNRAVPRQRVNFKRSGH